MQSTGRNGECRGIGQDLRVEVAEGEGRFGEAELEGREERLVDLVLWGWYACGRVEVRRFGSLVNFFPPFW